MLTREQIDQEIADLLDRDRLTQSVCQQLTWLYAIRDHLGGVETASRAAVSAPAKRYAAQTETPYMSREVAEQWVSGMENTDGTCGAHWTMEQAKQVQAQRNIPGDPAAFWAILNSVYSDYYAVAKKYGVNNVGFYADLAHAWLADADANDGKAAIYYADVVRH